MKQIPSDKYNVAWFTLAECVSRGEKVRAMSLYRLLAHSIKDCALTCQLKGDLLLAFRDNTAIELYEEAAEIYIKDKRLLEAGGVYEHLLTLDPENCRYIKALVKLYSTLKIDSKCDFYLQLLFRRLSTSQDCKAVCDIIDQVEESCAFEPRFIARKFIIYLLVQKVSLQDYMIELGKKVVESLAKNKDELDAFLSEIESLNDEYYLNLYDHIEHIQAM